MKTLYEVLEVSHRASPETLLTMRDRLLSHWQRRYDPGAPDHEGVAARLDAIRRAYAVLSDPILRRAYDERLATASDALQRAPGRSGGSSASPPASLPRSS